MKCWLGYALCVSSACVAQIDPYGLPPLERGLSGSSLLHASEGSSALPSPSGPGPAQQAILYHSIVSFGTPVRQSGLRLCGAVRRYLYSLDVARLGWSSYQTHRLRVGLSLPLNEHRIGARCAVEQWYRTEGVQPLRIYPEIAFWSTRKSAWNYALRIINPTQVRWLQSEQRSSAQFQAELCREVLENVLFHLGWQTIGTFSRWALGTTWYFHDRMTAVAGIASGGEWLSVGWQWRLQHWALHTSAHLQDHLGWSIEIGFSWRSS